MTVNYIRHFNSAIDYFQRTPSIQASHISLYVTLFHTWNQYFFHYEFPINSERTMGLSKIRSYKTYLRCLKELHNLGLITYTPGYGITHPAMISVTRWNDDDGELVTTHSATRVVFALKAKRYKGKKKGGNQEENTQLPKAKTPPFNKQYINNVKRESENSSTNPPHPSQNEIEEYFRSVGGPAKEARKFFFHYQARNWTVNGNIINDWESAVRKWLEADFSEIQKPGNLHVNQNKRYDIPL